MDLYMFVLEDHLPLIPTLVAILFAADNLVTVAESSSERIILDSHLQVALGMEEYFLLVLCIIETNFVVSLAARCCVGFDPANFVVVLVFRVQTIAEIRRHLVDVVDAADDDGLVRVAFEEIDDYFLADPRPEGRTPALAGPGLADPHPTGAVGIVLAVAVPMELNFDPSVLVGEDFLAGGSDHPGRLGALHNRTERAARRSVGQSR